MRIVICEVCGMTEVRFAVPNDIHRELRILAIRSGKTLPNYCIDLFKKAIREEKGEEGKD